VGVHALKERDLHRSWRQWRQPPEPDCTLTAETSTVAEPNKTGAGAKRLFSLDIEVPHFFVRAEKIVE
jgi:hypothetical protein